MKLSHLAENIQTSPILTIAAQINARKAAGETLYNLTVGDFNPNIFPIPKGLSQDIVDAYRQGETNYPGAPGMPVFRNAVAAMLKRLCAVDYDPDEIQIASGSRPLIYSAYRTLVDPGDKVVYPVPSWNNHYYTGMLGAVGVEVETSPDNAFMPSAEQIAPHLHDATLLALCSPQNPTGTMFTEADLKAICDLVVAENRRRGPEQKPLYVMFDQVYWLLTFGDCQFHHAVALCPEIRDYAVFIDGLSKCFAGTGIRVGWASGPRAIIGKMRSLIAHMGAWAPRPEQLAAGRFLERDEEVDAYLGHFRLALSERLNGFYEGFMQLKSDGYPVDAIRPQAAIYLTVRIDLLGRVTANGVRLDSHDAVHRHLLDEGHIGVLPFSWFGARQYGDWYRISVGTCEMSDVKAVLGNLRALCDRLQPLAA